MVERSWAPIRTLTGKLEASCVLGVHQVANLAIIASKVSLNISSRVVQSLGCPKGRMHEQVYEWHTRHDNHRNEQRPLHLKLQRDLRTKAQGRPQKRPPLIGLIVLPLSPASLYLRFRSLHCHICTRSSSSANYHTFDRNEPRQCRQTCSAAVRRATATLVQASTLVDRAHSGGILRGNQNR